MDDPSIRARTAWWLTRQIAWLGSISVRIDDSNNNKGWTIHNRRPNDLTHSETYEKYNDALTAWRKNPMARRIVDLTADYVIGDSIGFTSDHEPLNAFTTAFWEHEKNGMDDRLQRMVDELTRAGDLFTVLMRNEANGMSYIRHVIKPEIIEIVTAPNDWETETVFRQTLGAAKTRDWRGVNHPRADQTQNIMLHHTINRPIGAQFGSSDLESMLPWLLRYSRMLEDRVRLHWAARAFLWIVTVPSNKVEAKQQEYDNAPEGGSVIVKDDGETWEAINPELKGMDAAPDLRAIRMMINAGSGFPPTWYGEPEGSSQTTARLMQAPAERKLHRRQQYVVKMLQEMILTAYGRSGADPLPEQEEPHLKPQTTDVSRIDNMDLATAGSTIAQTFRALMLEEEPSSRRLTELMLRTTFKFIGEPQSESTIQTIADEIFSNLDKPETTTTMPMPSNNGNGRHEEPDPA